jgi:putative ABC transport system permease protein
MTLAQDVRDAVRRLRRTPGFACAAVLSLALGIGANTAIFSLLDQVLLRRLPVGNPDELVQLAWNGNRQGITIGGGDAMSYPAYRDIRDNNEVFTGVLGRFRVPLSVAYSGQTEQVAGELVSGNYFEVLRVGASIGRPFTQDDDRIKGAHPLAMLSHSYWVTRFASDPKVIGQTLIVDGLPLTIVGVGAKGFDGIEVGYTPRVWVPIAMKAQMTQGWFSEAVTLENRRTFWVQVFARLKPGVTRDGAQTALQPAFHDMLQRELREPGFADVSANDRAVFLRSWLQVEPGGQGPPPFRTAYGISLKVLSAIVGIVLLIACANVANLLLERALGRQREVAVRMALGAGTFQIIRHALVESILLAFLGGAAGLLVAAWLMDLLVGFVTNDEAPIHLLTTPDARVLLFTLVTCVATGVLFGIAPALASRHVDPAPTLKQDTRAIAGGSRWMRTTLVIAQVALSLVLAIAAGQFGRTLINLRRIDFGLRTHSVVVFSVNPSLNGYDKPRSREFYRNILGRLRETPGIAAVGASAIRVLDEDWWGGDISVEGEPKASDPGRPSFNLVSPGYLAALGIPLLAGRDFVPADATRKNRVALVNESIVRRYFNGRMPLGRRIALDPSSPADIEIVGVMKDAKYSRVRDDINPQVFLNDDQNEDILSIHVYLNSTLPPETLYGLARRAVQELDSNVPIIGMRTMEAQADLTLARERMVTSLTTAFGVLALILAAIGVYALMAFNVTRRTREIGVRVALGAQQGDVVWLVLRQILMLVAIGVTVGVPVAWSLSWLVRNELYGVQPWDWITTTAAALTLFGVAAVAGVVPARRATTIDPIVALRTE